MTRWTELHKERNACYEIYKLTYNVVAYHKYNTVKKNIYRLTLERNGSYRDVDVDVASYNKSKFTKTYIIKRKRVKAGCEQQLKKIQNEIDNYIF